jgi:hypothetical protein
MDIDLGQDVEFVVKYNGASFKMREPSVLEATSLKDGTDTMSIVDFLNKLGLPTEVANKMPVSKMKKLVETMLGAISEKK